MVLDGIEGYRPVILVESLLAIVLSSASLPIHTDYSNGSLINLAGLTMIIPYDKEVKVGGGPKDCSIYQ